MGDLDGEERVIFQTLDSRHPDLVAHDRLGAAHQGVFSIAVARGELEDVTLPDVATALRTKNLN